MSNAVAGTPGLDPTLPDVKLVLGGVERQMCFDYNAIVQAEKATGVNLLRAAVSDQSATTLRGLLWAALIKHDPKITIAEVGALITMRNAPVIHKALITAWFASVAGDDDTTEDETQGEAAAAKS